jgi:hypothetical protein
MVLLPGAGGSVLLLQRQTTLSIQINMLNPYHFRRFSQNELSQLRLELFASASREFGQGGGEPCKPAASQASASWFLAWLEHLS